MARTHGLHATYSAGGCHRTREEGCPGHPATGLSCKEAWNAYRRVKERVRRARIRSEREAG